MAETTVRMTNSLRDRANKLAREFVKGLPHVQELKAKLDAATAALTDEVRARHAEMFPPESQKVLRRYGVMSERNTVLLVAVSDTGGQNLRTDFPMDILMPNFNFDSQWRQIQVKYDLLYTWTNIEREYIRTLDKECAPYRKLILGSTTLKKIAEVWPEVLKLMPPEITTGSCTALSLLTNSERQKIEQDRATLSKNAAA